MRRFATFLTVFLCLTFVVGTVLAAGVPVPGVGVVIKRHPGHASTVRFDTPSLPGIPADFFNPGSEPFFGVVGLMGQCSFDCGGCDDDCSGPGDDSDSRIDYAKEPGTGYWETEMVSLDLYSTGPITVTNVSGIDSFFDVFVEISGTAGTGTTSGGTMYLAGGGDIAVGGSSFVVDSFFDIAYRISFADPLTGVAAGGVLTGTLRLHLQNPDLPIARLDDGSPEGVMVIGLGPGGAEAFTFADDNGGVTMTMQSLFESVVGTREATWGSVKSLYR